MGPQAGMRHNLLDDPNPNDTEDEKFTVVEGNQTDIAPIDINNGQGGDTVTVTAFGTQQAFTGVKRIFADGGAGKNTVTIQPGIQADAELHGGIGSSSADMRYLGIGAANLYAGSRYGHHV